MNLPAVLTGTLRRMHHVRRYSSVPVTHPENVAEHSWQVAMLCYLIGTDMKTRGKDVNMEVVLSRALLHDVSEAVSGDIIRSYKHSTPEMKEACDRADEINMLKLAQEIDGVTATLMYEDWREAKDKSIEGRIVALADLLCVVSYCVEQERMGNNKVLFVLQRMYRDSLYFYHDDPDLGRYVNQVYPRRSWRDPLQHNTEAV